MKLSDISIHAWLQEYGIRTETGALVDFRDHRFLFDIFIDESPKQAILKAAQIGFSTLAILKSFWIAMKRKMDIIYCLPTQEDVRVFAGGKINRIIGQNKILQSWVKDKDSVEQKAVGDSLIYYRGTWNQKQAISHSSDLNIYDEVDSSKQDVIEQYATRLQHSKYKWEWYFSHPSAPGFGIDRFWQKSDMKHWLIKCQNGHEQYLRWPESINQEKGVFQCKNCKVEITDSNRRNGRWAAKKGKVGAEFSGYWIPLLICPWVSAKEIIKYHKEKTEEYFQTKVLGLPYIGGGNKLTWELFVQNLTSRILTPSDDEPIVIGIDTGLKLDYVMGGEQGLFFHGEAKDYDELDKHMERWKKAIAVIDAGGDLIGSRKFKEKWKGRVYLCFTGGDRKTEELVKWGSGDEYFAVSADRNRIIQLVVDEFREGRIPCQGAESDWYDYWTDWNNLTRIKQVDPITGQFRGYKWVRSGRDHRALATAYWRVGMMRFGFGGAEIVGKDNPFVGIPVGPEIKPSGKFQHITISGQDPVEATLRQLKQGREDDWRDI